MNRKQRRAMGFTESRYRKSDVSLEGLNPRTHKPLHTYSREESFKLGNTTLQRTQRLDRKPRRWQTEKARRRLTQLTALTEELGL